MKKIIFFWLLTVSYSVLSETKVVSCKEHSNVLKIESFGHEHINHRPVLNGKNVVSELMDPMWFIENTSCTKNGFKVYASHRQYGDMTTKVFEIEVSPDGAYQINENI